MNKTETKQEKLTIPIPTFSKTDYNLALDKNYVFLGANGSGKSKLGLFIEASLRYEINQPTLRINAQRMLSITEKVNIMDHQDAKRQHMHGGYQPYFHYKGYSKEKIRNLYITGQLVNHQNDFHTLLSILFSQHQEIANKLLQEYKKCPSADIPIKSSALDTLKELWTKLLPERELITDGYNISIKQNGRTYNPIYLSDGEKVLLYLIGQCLIQEPGTTIIFDEPEIHINKSILPKLWNLLEEYRKDCIFIYITQDSDFALTRFMAEKIWVKKCNFHIERIQKIDEYSNQPNNIEELKALEWELKEIDQDNLPEDLLFSLLGNKKKVLFVEGKKSSLDKKIYEYVYPDFTIVPCGGCSEVAKMYSAYKASPLSHIDHIKSFAIIDRDRKSDEEITNLTKKGLQVLDFVTEIENVLLLPEILDLAVKNFGKDGISAQDIQNYIFEEYNKESEYEIVRNTVCEVNYKVNNSFEDIPENKDLHNIQSKLTEFKENISGINIEEIFNSKKQTIESIYKDKNYLELLKIMNRKTMPKRISGLLGLTNYKESTLKKLKEDENYRDDFVKILTNYLPQLDKQ